MKRLPASRKRKAATKGVNRRFVCLLVVCFCGGSLVGMSWHRERAALVNYHPVAQQQTEPKQQETTPQQEPGPEIYCDQNSTHPGCCSESQCELVRQSTMYSACCHNQPVAPGGKLFPLMITGTPRSGTDFLTGLINYLATGRRRGTVSHDWEFDPNNTGGMVSCCHIRYEPDDVYYGPAKLQGSKFHAVWHLLRDPLKSMTSIAFADVNFNGGYGPKFIKYMKKYVPLAGNCFANSLAESERFQCFLRQTMELYFHWHDYLDQLKLPRFKLEDLAVHHNLTILDEIFKSMNLPPPNHDVVLARIQPNGRRRLGGATNSRHHRPTLEWWELCQIDKARTVQILRMSQRWGYYLHVPDDPCDEAAMRHPPFNFTPWLQVAS